MNKDSWRAALEKAGVERLASLIRHVSILSQTKVYLFWQRKHSASMSGVEELIERLKVRSSRFWLISHYL